MHGASLFFTPLAGPTKGWILVCLPWGSPQIGNPPILVAVCDCCCPLLLLLLFLIHLQYHKPQHLIWSLYQQPEFHWWLLLTVLFLWSLFILTVHTLAWIALLCWTAGHSCRNARKDYYCAGSKTDLNPHWQCTGKLLLFKSVEVFTNVDVCMLHTSVPQPLQSAPALQEACLCTLL